MTVLDIKLTDKSEKLSVISESKTSCQSTTTTSNLKIEKSVDNKTKIKMGDKYTSKSISSAKEETIDLKQADVVSSTASVENNISSEICNKDDEDLSKKLDSSKSLQPVAFKTVLTNPGYEYWKTKNPVVDKVFITDVMVDLNTVTIRECSTEKGFFRERQVVEKKSEGLNEVSG